MVSIDYAIPSDFDFIYELAGKNSDNLGFVHPIEIRESIADNKIIIAKIDDINIGFCIFNVLKKYSTLLTVYSICVDTNYRNIGIARTLIYFLQQTYNRDIKATCIKDSDSERFWNKIAKKYGESSGKHRAICHYILEISTNKLF